MARAPDVSFGSGAANFDCPLHLLPQLEEQCWALFTLEGFSKVRGPGQVVSKLVLAVPGLVELYLDLSFLRHDDFDLLEKLLL